MANYECLADGHHVDDAGNLIACTYVDFRDPAEWLPVAALRKGSSKRHAIPDCETVRLSKPACFLDQGEGFNDGGESHHGTNGWIYCASIEPETAEEQAAWRMAMPAGRDAVSSIRRPREFARALGAMVAEQAGPRGRIVLLRNTVEGRTFCTAHKSQTVYHGPVAYLDDPHGRLESASSALELALLLLFVKHAAHRAQREYRFLVWAEDEPAEDVLDLDVSPALIDAMLKPRPEPEGGGFVRPGAAEYSAVEDAAGGGASGARARVEALPAFLGAGNPAVAPRPGDVETLPGAVREAADVRAGLEALRSAVDRADAGCRKDAAAAGWHAEAVVRFLCATFGCGVGGVQVGEDGFIVIMAELPGDDLVDVSITVGPEGTCAGRVSAGGAHTAATAADARSFETLLTERLAQVGVAASGDGSQR